MKPILFAENSTSFTTNGIGRLSDAISCVVTEERNGQYELSMEYPSTGIHFEDIKLRAIIVAKPSAGASNQPFRIYNISRPINGKVTIDAQHISYDLSKNVSMPFSVTASAGACASTLAALKTNAVETCPFTFTTDVTTVASYNQTVPGSIRQRLGGIEGSVLDQFGGEYEFDGYTVNLHKDRGSTKDIPLRYGKNITDINQEENISNTITGIVPYWADNEGGEVVTLTEKVVYSPNASLYPQKLTVPMDFSSDFETKPTEASLRTHAQAYVNKSGVGIPQVSIQVSFINLADTEEYKDIAPLQQVKLCDTIPVQFEALGIDTTAKIVATDYDVLKERYNSITVGSLRSNLTTTITDQNSEMVASTSAKFAKVGDEIDNATAWLTSSGGYVIAVKNTDGTWKEIIFADHQDPTEWVHCLRINENGIGFSSDGGTTYTHAWTLDGNLVIGGTDVPSITVYDSNQNIIFKADATAMVWNALNSSMSSNGTISMTGASISNGVIKMVGSNSWLQLEEGAIFGGRGTTVGQNQTSIEFDSVIDNTSGNIVLSGTVLGLDCNKLGIRSSRGSGTYWLGEDSSYKYVTSLDYYEYNFTTNLDIQSDGQGGISWSYSNVQMGVAQGDNWRTIEATHGIVTGL